MAVLTMNCRLYGRSGYTTFDHVALARFGLTAGKPITKQTG
jgi:hypothetical protein